MISEFKPYPAYRDSGVEWLGEVPEHWQVARLKTHLVRNDPGAWGTDFADNGTIVLRSTEQTLEGGWRVKNPARRLLSQVEKEATLLHAGDLVVTKSSGSPAHIGKTSLVTAQIEGMECGFSNFTQRLRPDSNTAPRFIWAFLNNRAGRDQLVYYSTTTTGLGNLNGTILGNLWVVFPSPPEQSAMVRFLDHVDRRIRRYIRSKQRLIALLHEQRQAVLHRAVTRGLDPNVPLKPSGVAWLGDVPEHWEVAALRLRYSQCLGKMLDTKRILGVHSLAYVRNVDVQWDRINTAGLPMMDIAPNEYQRYTVRSGDLLVCEGGEVGRSAIWNDELARCGFQKALHRLRPLSSERDLPRFLLHALQVASKAGAFDDGHHSTIAHLTGDKLRAHRLAFPPKAEQIRIVAHLDRELGEVDRTVMTVGREISLLREYRTRLIADVVTGKLDVREAAARLPEETDEPEPLDDTDTSPEDISDETAAPDLDAALEEAEA